MQFKIRALNSAEKMFFFLIWSGEMAVSEPDRAVEEAFFRNPQKGSVEALVEVAAWTWHHQFAAVAVIRFHGKKCHILSTVRVSWGILDEALDLSFDGFQLFVRF